ncbi:S8 family serine peptidase [Luteimonas sp. MC1782]|uniref:S8 family serine peptidase n=1 Tax=Luteimonas sp. MC1782 TaxID=2760305 RepID=UPI0015FFACC1|nr:autotransporter serine protease [Luteimonas sp. MC1782]MBB1471641.1 S8 family serine peptidase [Luteimonas sp. MC1782]
MAGIRWAGTDGRTIARLAVAMLAAALAACGGGGGGDNVRVDPPPAAPPPPPPPPVVEAPNPAYSQHLVHTNAAAAHAAGYTGAGVRIGFVDSGVNRNHPAFGGRVVSNLVYIDGRNNNLTVDDVVGHGTAVAQAAAGQAFGKWPGGIAPGAEIVSARIISDSPPEDDGSGEGNEVDGPLGLAGVHRDLIDRGVRIMNNSWGGLYWSNPNVTAAIAAEYRPFIIGNDGLVVFATGNSAFAAPSDMAALPSQQGPGGSLPAADLARGWIAVAALAEGSTSHLATYSNACGIAMDYCMVAPGTVVVTGADNPPHAPDYWRWSGTSLAAPLVSGAAALVWQAFPYFNNDLVRQTLLGTATDLGASGIDPVFGNGALDVGKAVGGPARLDWGTVTADFDGFSSSWWNQLSGAGAVRKQGSGTLVLENNALNGGGLEVAEGTLHARGGVAGDVWVGPAGRFLTGTRLWGGLENAGRVEVRAPGGQGGSDRLTLEVQGDLIHRAGATLGIELGTGLRVIGAAVIEGGALQVLGVRNGYTSSSREELLFATARVTGTFDALTAAPGVFLDASLAYTDFHVWLDIQRLDITAVAASFDAVTPASMLSAERIEQAFREIDRQQRDAGGAIDGGFITAAGEFQRIGTQAGAQRALSSLSGELHAAATAMTLDTIDMGRRALSSRLDAFDGNARGAGAWTRTLGSAGEGGLAGNGFAVDGWLMGRDHDLGNGATAGFAFGETRALGRVEGLGDRGHDRQTLGTAYAGWLRGNAYLSGQATSGRFQRDIERRLFAGGDTAGVSSRYGGDYSAASLETGYRFDIAGVALTPYIAAQHARMRSDGFNEGGADGFGLRTDAWSASRSQAIAGLRMQGAWHGLRVHGYGEWQETLAASGFDVAASFTGVQAWAPLGGQAPALSGGAFGLGVQSRLGRNAMLGLGFDQRFGPRGDERMVSLRYAAGF